MIFTLLIKGPRPMPLFHLPCTFSHLEFKHPKLKLKHLGSSIMSGSDHQGRWMASSVTEEDIAKLREAGYLIADVKHRLPAPEQFIPTPEPNESVVFVSHFLQGLGLTLDPFVRGLMFYYGLDFYDLAPNSILHISSFIVVCEGFLHVTPHFGLWIKTFNVKPKMIEGRHVECGGAIISRNADAPWPEGSFPEVSDVWQRRWFYVTAPRGTKWEAAPSFARALRHSWRLGQT